MADQARWPKGTPVAPGGQGPGGGRFRPAEWDAFPDAAGYGGRAFPGAKKIPLSLLADRPDVWGGDLEVWDQQNDRWVALAEIRPGRATERLQIRDAGPGPATFTRYADEQVLVRQAGNPDWAERVSDRITPASPEQQQLREDAMEALADPVLAALPKHPTHAGARVIDSAKLAETEENRGLLNGDYEVHNPETGDWEELVWADFDERGGVNFVGIGSRNNDTGEWSGFTTSDEPDQDGADEDGVGDEEYQQILQSWEDDSTRDIAVRRRQHSSPPRRYN